MQIQSVDKNYRPQFSGLTRTLSKNYFATFEEIKDVFEKHPKADGIAGSLPYSWIKNIQHKPKAFRDSAIKEVYQTFRDIFTEPEIKSLKEKSKILTKALHKAEILPESNIVIIKSRKLDGRTISGVFTIHEKGKNPALEPVFIKKFKDKEQRAFRKDYDGLYPETALGLHFNKLMADRHIWKFFWSDVKAGYIASHYDAQPQNVKIPRHLMLSSDEIDKENYFKKLMKITGDYTDIRKILAKYGFIHRDYHDENIVITRDKKGNLITRLIDLGRITRINERNSYYLKFINYNHATKSFE